MTTTLALVALITSPTLAADANYTRDIKPLLKHRCYACHGTLAQKANLRLDAGAFIFKGGKHGPAVKPGMAEASLLIERVTRNLDEEGGRMPPEGPALTAEEVAKLRAWITAGAKVPADDKPEPDPREHWAFRPIVRPNLPAGADARHPIDALVSAKRAKLGLSASAPADRATLLRRVTLDLIGLPPTPEELHAFLADKSENAYEKVVDRLLSRPEYGERWARHWMDVWRYSDWYGRRAVPDNLNSYGQIWRWRDWIVRSLNEDKGYDWMVRMMLAADELAPGDDANAVATGFVVRNFYRWNYNSWMKDQVEHTGKAFLGLTMNCCQCHDHKYDPITQVEYFKLRAVFEPMEIRHDRVSGEADPGVYEKYRYGVSYGPIKSGLVRVMDEKLDAKTFLYTGGEERNIVAGKPPIPPGAPAALGGGDLPVKPVELPLASWAPGLKTDVLAVEIAAAERAAATTALAAKTGQTALAAYHRAALFAGTALRAAEPLSIRQHRLLAAQAETSRLQLASLQARLAAERVRLPKPGADFANLARAASQREREANHAAAVVAELQAEAALDALRGKPANDAAAKAARAKAQTQLTKARTAVAASHKALAASSDKYTPLGPTYPTTSTGRRSALAEWITDRQNPLAARVAVNHLWGWHFGRPLCESTHDLGRNGKKPSHPELIDWLAAELMDNGWRMKPLHRAIVLSQTYRQSSRLTGVTPSIDPDNVYLWRFPPQRLEAEVVRDSILAVAGSLDRTIGGAPLPHEQGLTSPRRSLYFEHHGEAKMQFLELFDAANACDCYRRSTSVLPQQALALSNGELALKQSRLLAGRLSPGKNDSAFVAAAFEQILGRPATASESSAALAFLKKQGGLFGASGLKTDPQLRARANLVQALFSHSDFVTVR